MQRPSTTDIVNTALALTLLVTVPALWLSQPPFPWSISMPTVVFAAAFSAAYVAAVATLFLGAPNGRPPLAHVLTTGLATLGVVFIVLALLPAGSAFAYPKRAVGAALIGGLGLLCVTMWFPRRSPATVALGGALAAAIGAHFMLHLRRQDTTVAPSRAESHVDSSLYALKITHYSKWLEESVAHGGGLALLAGRLLVADGDGNLYRVSESPNRDGLDVDPLSYRIPLNSEEFAAGGRAVFSDRANAEVEVVDFRVASIAVRERGEAVQVFASHHYWREDERCYVLRVSVLEGSLDDLISASGGLAWRTVFDTEPCLPLDTEGQRGPRFEGYENGGRMAFLSDEEMLLTVGDQGFDGVNRTAQLAQALDNSYGKTLLVNLETGVARVFTIGHRNPQGLQVIPGGNIWLTEHGPRGGDELNLLTEGTNYGWPLATYGTDYPSHDWPLIDTTQSRHGQHSRPIFAFVPSIAITQVIVSASELFPAWRDDLLIGSLKALTLTRVRVREGRAILAEPILIGSKIRDLLIQPDGRIVLLSPFGDIMFVDPADTMAGESLITMCTGCHGLNESDRAALAPNLWGIIGRPIAADPDFTYSAALAQEAAGYWTRDQLDRFLEDPATAVPGTSMVFPGISDDEQRKRLVDYLETLRRTE